MKLIALWFRIRAMEAHIAGKQYHLDITLDPLTAAKLDTEIMLDTLALERLRRQW